MSTVDEVEAWVHEGDLESVVAEHMLAPVGQGSVRLHVTGQPLANLIPLARLLANLAAYSGPRESAAVHRLLHED